MKALNEIGIRKALAFIFYTLVSGLLKIVIFPQIRSLIMVCLGAKIGSDSIIGNITFSNLYHYGFSRLKVGDRVFIGDEALLDLRGGIDLGDDVTISNRSVIVTHINVGYENHPLQKYYPTKETKVVIKNGAYLGTACLILPGIIVGKDSVVGAGAVVTKDVPSRTVVAGNPAKEIKRFKLVKSD